MLWPNITFDENHLPNFAVDPTAIFIKDYSHLYTVFTINSFWLPQYLERNNKEL